MRGQRLYEGRKRARRVLRVWRALVDAPNPDFADDGPLEQVMRFTRVRCSGMCCGNPRRQDGTRTVQERRFYQESLDWVLTECAGAWERLKSL